MTLRERHMQLVDQVNNAKDVLTHNDHGLALYWWREGVKDAGMRLDFCAVDMIQIERGHNRPMCCGVFLDWTPKT